MNGHRLIAELSNLDIRYTKKPKLVILLVTSDILNIFRRDTFCFRTKISQKMGGFGLQISLKRLSVMILADNYPILGVATFYLYYSKALV